MASKIELVTVNTPLNSTSFQQQINSNFTAIEDSLNKQLQREPQEDVNNAMQQEIDMNSYRIINLGEPINPADAARKKDVDDLTTEIQDYVALAKDWATKTDGTVDGEEYSAKHYAQEARDVIDEMSIANCRDVDLDNPSDGQALVYDGASDKWTNQEVRQTFRGVYNATTQYHTGDIVQGDVNHSSFYQAIQDTLGNYTNSTSYWSLISEDHLVNFRESTDNEELNLGLVPHGFSGSLYNSGVSFTLRNGPTVNPSTGSLTAPNLTTTTQTQGDNSTKAATTAYVDTGLATKEDTIADLTTIRSGAAAGATALQPGDVVDATNSTATDAPLSANMGKSLQDQVNNLQARGRFLALWDCSTGLAESNPPESPYTYHSGDYFIVGTVATGGASNYKPTGSSYTTGVASSTVETEVVDVDDVYYYDGTNWKLQVNTQKTVSFVNIAGSPYDNSNLSSALSDKANKTEIPYKGTYDNTRQYNTGDYVVYTVGSPSSLELFMNVYQCTGEAPTNTTYWRQISPVLPVYDSLTKTLEF